MKADPWFASTTQLARILRDQDFANGRVKPTSLRLQVSVFRGDKGALPDDKHLGVIAAGVVSSLQPPAPSDIRFECVDDPTPASPSHALIALVVTPCGERPESDVCEVRVREARSALARSLRIVPAAR